MTTARRASVSLSQPRSHHNHNHHHLLLVPLPAWGHVRPAFHLALRLLNYDERITVTFLTIPNMLEMLQPEVAEHLDMSGGAAQRGPGARMRILTTFEYTHKDIFKTIGLFIDNYPGIYKALVEERAVTCAMTNTQYDPVSAPVAILMDFFLTPLINATRALTGALVPILAWATGAPHALIRFWGPAYIGGLGDSFYQRVDAQARRLGVNAEDIGDEMYKETSGAIVQLPGLPPMYDHEFFPQPSSSTVSVFSLLQSGHQALELCDAVVLSSTYVFDRGGIEAIKTWFSAAQKQVYSVGPLLPHTFWDEDDKKKDGNTADVQAFLDAMQEKYGSKSVYLISFGTLYWPGAQDYVEEVIEALLEKEAPFILSQSSPMAHLSDDLKAKVNLSNIAMLSKWVPQRYVLAHPVTGWFLTHGGQSSMTEALGSGIPMICWPLEGDQPMASVNAVHILRVAFELVEVRTGPGMGPLYRLGGRKPVGSRAAVGREVRQVIDASRGPTGQEMRRNAEAIRDEMRKSWDNGSDAMTELRLFAEELLQLKK